LEKQVERLELELDDKEVSSMPAAHVLMPHADMPGLHVLRVAIGFCHEACTIQFGPDKRRIRLFTPRSSSQVLCESGCTSHAFFYIFYSTTCVKMIRLLLNCSRQRHSLIGLLDLFLPKRTSAGFVEIVLRSLWRSLLHA